MNFIEFLSRQKIPRDPARQLEKVAVWSRNVIIESLSKRRICQHGRQPEVNQTVTDGE